MEKFRATTIIAVKKDGQVAIAGDGQVTFGDTVFKSGAKKIRKMYDDTILMGFAGSAADAFALFDKFEGKLDEFGGNLKKASVELAKEWRHDKALRVLEAMLVVADRNNVLIVSGNGDVIEPDDGIAAIGSGGTYAYAAAKALVMHSQLGAPQVAEEALKIAGNMCIYTNLNISVETL
jgi:ATP-dependent HslUV protease subunit HslV